MAGPTSVIVEADGGSRGNPGPAAYGALLKDADTGQLLAEDGAGIGTATNNVAEYRGLIAGLELAASYAPDADIEVRMDSKLVVEQMSGRWKIKHPDMRPLAVKAQGLAPFGTTYTWIPRERNKHADRLVNEALDGKASGVRVPGGSSGKGGSSPAAAEGSDEEPAPAASRRAGSATGERASRGWSAGGQEPTTLLLLRHGETPMTQEKRFSGGFTGSDPALTETGRRQVRDAVDWLAKAGWDPTDIVASPLRRTRESAAIVGERLGLPVREDRAFAETEFGDWDGLTFAELSRRYPEQLTAWLDSRDQAPPGGESFLAVRDRVRAGLDRLLADFAGRTVVVVSHVTPIKTLVTEALGADLDALFRMELGPASLSVVSFWPVDEDGRRSSSLRLFNGLPDRT